jgi:hypothetical protein
LKRIRSLEAIVKGLRSTIRASLACLTLQTRATATKSVQYRGWPHCYIYLGGGGILTYLVSSKHFSSLPASSQTLNHPLTSTELAFAIDSSPTDAFSIGPIKRLQIRTPCALRLKTSLSIVNVRLYYFQDNRGLPAFNLLSVSWMASSNKRRLETSNVLNNFVGPTSSKILLLQ